MNMMKLIDRIRNSYRLQQLQKKINQFKIKQLQNFLLMKNYSRNTRDLIVFLTPGYDGVWGGILSISSIYQETVRMKYIHGAEVILCVIPGDSLLLKYTKFENQNYIFRFPKILLYFRNLKKLMIHIPEYCIGQFLDNISEEDYRKLKRIKNLHINIMIQNIKLLAPMEHIEELKRMGKVTSTTAHAQYSNSVLREKLGFSLHKLSVYVSPEQYNKKVYAEKENLMIVSPDNHAKKSEVLALIAEHFPKIKIQVIHNLTYEQYKKVISQAKWALTFGEGIDGYFVETIFSGGVGFAVYNTDFFTHKFQVLRTVYNSYDELLNLICEDIKNLDNEKDYTNYHDQQFQICATYYKHEEYLNNLERFYQEDYTYK